jgi:hypothetical protein
LRVIIGGVYYPTLEGSSVRITGSASDPVSTCALDLVDNTSSIAIRSPQEILVLDDQLIPNPAVNLLLNPSLNPYGTSWNVSTAGTGETFAQVGGGGFSITVANVAGGDLPLQQTTVVGSIVPGQAYTLSFFAQGSNTPTNLALEAHILWLNTTSSNNSGAKYGAATYGFASYSSPNVGTADFFGAFPVSTTLARYSLTGVAPATANSALIELGYRVSSTTNSGTISYTQIQFEPNWFPNLSYPTPWCGPAQTNCRQLPLGLWIRQYRKFAGFVSHDVNADYKGNVRTVQVDAVGYAWLCGTIYCNDSFTNTADSTIFTTLLNKYLKSNGVNMLNTAQIVQGYQLSNMQSNWDDLRTIFDNLAAQSGFSWTFDYYWNAIYAPPGYYTLMISLICDNSAIPDNITTFPAYTFSNESDYTQPGATILVLGNGTNVAEVVAPGVAAELGILSGYSLPTGTSWMRKVNESTLNSVADCTRRGEAEFLQYANPRAIVHLKANVELRAGYSVPVTSSTDGLNRTMLLLQQVTATWLGTNETLTDEWEYTADLGATNRTATNIISRIFRATTRGTSAPAISTLTAAALDTAQYVDSLSGTLHTPVTATYGGSATYGFASYS